MVFVKGPMGAGTKLGRGLGVAVSWTDSRAQAHCWAQAHSPREAWSQQQAQLLKAETFTRLLLLGP